jgi:biopolymer transport protein ExbD
MFDVTVRNGSAVPGFMIIPVYLTNPFARIALPNQQLVGMKKVYLQANEKQVVSISIDRQFLTYIDEQYQRQPLKGKLSFTVGQPEHPLMISKDM